MFSEGPMQAEELGNKAVQEELRKRGLEVSPFHKDNVVVLQRVFDEEWEEQRAETEKRQAQALERKRKEEEQLRKKRVLERQRAEEAEAVRSDHRVQFFIDLLGKNETPKDMVLRVSPVAVRAVVKSMHTNESLKTLDLCRADLKDDVGLEVAKMLQTNSSLQRLDLDFNKLGPDTARALGTALASNQTLKALSLERNDLTDGGEVDSGVESIAKALAFNTTLTSLNLFKCGLGVSGGAALAHFIRNNTTILQLHISNMDNIRLEDMKGISATLERNNTMLRDSLVATAVAAETKAADEAVRIQVEADEARRKAEEDWIEQQRLQRALARKEAEYEATRKEELARQEREAKEKKRRDDAKAAAEAAAAKKKKKGKKK